MSFSQRHVIGCMSAMLLIFFLSGCHGREEVTHVQGERLFELVSPDASGIDFINRISPDDTINILTYEYMYNGAGVGIGDFNLDGFPDVFLAGSQVPGKLYINQGQRSASRAGIHFVDMTENAGITRDDNWAFGVSVVDVNQDGLPDIYVSMGGPGNMNSFPNQLFVHQGLKDGQPVFKEMAAAYGLADKGQSIQGLFFDYDRDGDLDLYLLTGGGFERSPNNPSPIVQDGTAVNTDRLYRNDFDLKKGHPVFVNVSNEAGIVHEGYGLGVALADINEDGWPDVYVTNDYLTNDHLYINNRDGTFSEKVSQYFKHTSHFAMGNDVGDINNDGLLDIIAVDMLPEDHARRKLMFGATQYNKFYYAVNHGYTHQYMRNTLQLNNGNGSFSEVGQLSGVHQTDWSWAVLLADFNNDELQDIFITNGFGKDVTDLDFVKFRSNMTSEIRDETQRRRVLLDSLATRPGIKFPNYAYRNNGDLSFTKVTKEWGFDRPSYSNGVAYADFDNDGDLDMIVSNLDEVAFLYRNTQRDRHQKGSNFLQVKLVGSGQNMNAIGSTVTIRYGGKLQSKLKSPVHGFQSSMDDNLHFGLSTVGQVDTVEVRWPDGKVSTLTHVPANQLVVVTDSSRVDFAPRTRQTSTIFEGGGSEYISHRHIENHFVDFNHEPLLPNKLSQEGPGIAVGDVNGDGLEDFFLGGALLSSGRIFLQKRDGRFTSKALTSDDVESEDMGCLFFDADSDQDLDLYVVSGGNEYNPDHRHYQDRLYFNDGNGNFSKGKESLPRIGASGSCVTAADYDHDGDVDLFVGGRVLPTAYPKSPRSYLLRNDGKGVFEDATLDIAPELAEPGMVTSALWTDFDNDHWIDLVIVGEYMPISFFRNEGGKRLVRVTDPGLKHSEGWWKSITAGDFDNDGDIDYIAGNFGLNTHYRASPAEPINVTFKDFDHNGALEAITSYYEDGVNYPIASLDVLTNQLPLLKRKLLYHRTYARTSTEQLLQIAGGDEIETLYCKTLQSVFVENTGNGTFRMRPLPLAMQTAPIYGVLSEDVNHDSHLDFIAVGNSYALDVVSGRCDAFIGQVMAGDGAGNFNAMPINETGFFVQGDAKGIVRLGSRGKAMILVTQNNDSLKVFSTVGKAKSIKYLRPEANEVTAVMLFDNGKERRIEMGYGSSYLSQSSRSIAIGPRSKKLMLFDVKGAQTRAINY